MLHIFVTSDPVKAQEISSQYYDARSDRFRIPILHWPEEGIEEIGWDDACFQILKSGNRVVICSQEFADHLRNEFMKVGVNRQEFAEGLKHLARVGLNDACSKIGFSFDDAVLIEKNRIREGGH